MWKVLQKYVARYFTVYTTNTSTAFKVHISLEYLCLKLNFSKVQHV